MKIRVIILLASLLNVLHTKAQSDSTVIDTLYGTLSFKTVLHGFHEETGKETTIAGMPARKIVERVYCQTKRFGKVICSEKLLGVEIRPYQMDIWQKYDWKKKWWEFKETKNEPQASIRSRAKK